MSTPKIAHLKTLEHAVSKATLSSRRRAGLASRERTNPLSPIVRSTLHDEVVDRLRRLIVDGDLLPESHIPELEICRRLGISRTPLREALKVLAAEGLVTLIPHRGASVTKLEPDSVDYMFQVLESLEALAGELACSHMSEKAIGEVRTWHEEMIRCYKRHDRITYFHLNQRIHESIVRQCGNPILVGVYEGLGSRVRYARYMVNLSPESWQEAVREHHQILGALEARNGRRLARILKKHLRRKRDYVKNVPLSPPATLLGDQAASRS